MAVDKPKRRGRDGPRPPKMAMGAINKRLRGSSIIYDNRDELAIQLLGLASASVTDVVSWDDDGKVKVRAFKDVPDHVKAAIKKVKITPTQHGDILEFEMVDKVRVLQMLAKSAGLLDSEKVIDKPSVISIDMIMPSEAKEEKGNE
tara:strand:- start:344 stop:781 length:438 start_codon:yes stop_codon:yes gene_type:complete